VAVYLTIFLIGHVSGNLRVALIEPAISFLEIIFVGFDEAVLTGINKTCFKQEFPQGIHVYFIADMDVRIYHVAQYVAQISITGDIHIQDCQAATEQAFFFLSAVQNLCGARHGQCAGVVDVESMDDHARDQDGFIIPFVYREPGNGDIINITLHPLSGKRVFKVYAG